MTLIFVSLAVYKLVQLFDAMTPKEVMPWVKVALGVILGYALSFFVSVPDRWLSGLVIATLAGTCHGLLRLLTLLGDMLTRR